MMKREEKKIRKKTAIKANDHKGRSTKKKRRGKINEGSETKVYYKIVILNKISCDMEF